jgi:hypothetical protein
MTMKPGRGALLVMLIVPTGLPGVASAEIPLAPVPYFAREECRVKLDKVLIPLPLIRVASRMTSDEVLAALKRLGINAPEKGLPKLDPKLARVSNGAWVAVGDEVPSHEWLLPVRAKIAGFAERMVVAAWARDGRYFVDVGYAVVADENPKTPTKIMLFPGTRAAVADEILERAKAVFPGLSQNEIEQGRPACTRLRHWDDLATGASGAAVAIAEQSQLADENKRRDEASPVYLLQVERIKGPSCSAAAATCEPVSGIKPSATGKVAPDTGKRRCTGWVASCRYDVPERLLDDVMKRLVRDGVRFRISTAGQTTDSTDLAAKATRQYERLVCSQRPDGAYDMIPNSRRDEDVDCVRVTQELEAEFLRDVPSPSDVLAAIKNSRPCKLATTPAEWKAIQSGSRLQKAKKPAQCGARDFVIFFPVIIHDGRTKHYGARECSGVSAFTDDADPSRHLYSIGFSIRNVSQDSLSLSIGDFYYVSKDPHVPPTADTIFVAKYQQQATRLACQRKVIEIGTGEEDGMEIVYSTPKHSPWLLINPKAGLYVDISGTAFEDLHRLMMHGDPDHGLPAQDDAPKPAPRKRP